MSKGARGCAVFVLLMGIAVGCGGKSLLNEGNSSGGAPSASGGQAGASGAGASASGAGGATSSDACSLPQQSGTCDAYESLFWHNPKTGVCEPFTYGGCGGNANRFATREACLAQCPGGGSDWAACKLDEDCTELSTTCCQVCDPVDISQLLVLNEAHVSDQTAPCAASGVCLPCPSVGELDGTLRYLKPVCVSGQCSIIDVRQTPLTDCTTDADCILRANTGCCGCGDASTVIAANQNANFCDTMDISCPACTWPDIDLFAKCQQGKCTLSK